MPLGRSKKVRRNLL